MSAVLERHDVVESTQDLVHTLGAQGAAHGAAVVATEQRGGRGSRGRIWHSPAGGLWLSLLWRPAGAELGPLSLRVGVAVAAAVEAVAPTARVALKWPNDLILDDRKLGGILCEARWSGEPAPWVAVGIGINVVNPLPEGALAVRLAEVAPAVTPEVLAEPLLAAVRALDASRPELAPDEATAFAARDWLRGRRLARPASGVADGITLAGQLRVRQEDGTVALVRDGSVVLAPPTSLTLG